MNRLQDPEEGSTISWLTYDLGLTGEGKGAMLVANDLQWHKEAALMEGELVPLGALGAGEIGVVERLAGGRGLTSRLATLGFTPGARVNMVQNFGRGPVIVMVRGTRIALGRGEAQKIIVTPIAEGGE